MPEKIPLDIAVALTNLPNPDARDVLSKSSLLLSKQNWDNVSTISIREAMNEEYVGKPVKIQATIAFISDPKPKELTPKGNRITAFSMRLQDKNNNRLICTEIPYNKFSEKIQRYFNQRAFYIFKGTILSVINPNYNPPQRYYVFYLHDIEENITALDLINLKSSTSEHNAKIFLKHASAGGNIFNFIKNTLIRNLKIKGLDKARQLDKCIDFMIYQSLSQGIHNNNSMKLHSLIIGAPGEGKKLLVKIAEILNPVFRESSGVKITPAGLVGNVKSGSGGSYSDPGDLPRASGGVLCIQDSHEISKNRTQIQEIFTQVMEDGVAIDSTSARTRHEAIASVHFDMNRQSQIIPFGNFNNFTDINIRTNLLSRFDFIMDIPPDKEREFQVALSMLKNIGEIDPTRGFISLPQWQRDLKLIIAYIRTYFGITHYTKNIEKLIWEKLQQFIRDDERYKNIPNGMMTRLAVSILKYSMAISSANLRMTVTEDDIDKAFDFIEEKLKFLSTIRSEDVGNSEFQSGISTQNKRWKYIKTHFTGQIVTQAVLHDYIQKYYTHPVDKKTISRDLKIIGERKAHGKWLIL